MGWTVLYLAFGLVALWLLGEVLLQYKARLRWRLLAFCGFLGVVLGVVLPSVVVIAAGAGAFAVGQTLVTMSFRKGFSTGWALGGKPGTSRRRREIRPMAPLDEGAEEYDGYDDRRAPDGEPARDGYDGYDQDEYAADGYRQDKYRQDGYRQDEYAADGYSDRDQDGYAPDGAPRDAYPGEDYRQPAQRAAAPRRESQDLYAAYGQAPDYAATTTSGYGEYGGYPAGPGDAYPQGYDLPRHDSAATAYAATVYGQDPGAGPGYPAYSDPYIGGGYQEYGSEGGGYFTPAPQQAAGAHGGYDAPGTAAPGPWQAPDPYYQETPPGGVWTPQQRDTVPPESYPQPQPYGVPQVEPQGYYYDGRGY